MALENHPASFGIVARDVTGAADNAPPATWRHEGLDYDLVPNGERWDVLVGGRLLGCLEHDHPADGTAPRHWRISDPEHEALGIGASWGDWQDAVIALIDYRRSREA